MDIVFNCPHCGLEIEVDQDAAGQQFDCPTCQKALTVPEATASAAPATPVPVPTPAASAPREEKRMAVPVSQKAVESLIQKPNKSLELAAKESKPGMRVKTIRHSDCKEVGKDKFDEVVSDFLNKIGDQAIVSITPVNYSYLDIGTQKLLTDFGVMVIYRG
ncbi:MAG: hypothetical protein RIT19_1952 [Verrucomicrobiota bacterium]|jgi:hypothetical protein